MQAATKVLPYLMAKSALKSIQGLTPKPFSVTTKPCTTLFETIAIKEGKAQHLPYHQQRVDNAFKQLLKKAAPFNLESIVKEYCEQQKFSKNNLYRLKLIYNQEGINTIAHFDYRKKEVKNLLLIEVGSFSYSHKFLNRDLFTSLHKSFRADEFILTKNGYLTDSTIANIALLDSKEHLWHTPKEPLLLGTTRARYLQEGKLIPKDIHYSSLANYSKIALLNAMVDFYIL